MVVDSVVEEEHVVRETRPAFAGGVTDTWGLRLTVPVHHSRLVLDAPESLPLRYRVYRMPDLRSLTFLQEFMRYWVEAA